MLDQKIKEGYLFSTTLKQRNKISSFSSQISVQKIYSNNELCNVFTLKRQIKSKSLHNHHDQNVKNLSSKNKSPEFKIKLNSQTIFIHEFGNKQNNERRLKNQIVLTQKNKKCLKLKCRAKSSFQKCVLENIKQSEEQFDKDSEQSIINSNINENNVCSDEIKIKNHLGPHRIISDQIFFTKCFSIPKLEYHLKIPRTVKNDKNSKILNSKSQYKRKFNICGLAKCTQSNMGNYKKLRIY